MHFAIVDPALRSMSGHYYNYDAIWLTEAINRGMTPLLIHHVNLTGFDMPVKCFPNFTTLPTPTMPPSLDPVPAQDAEYARIKGQGIPKDSLILIPAVSISNALSVARWLRDVYTVTSPRVIIVLFTHHFAIWPDENMNRANMILLKEMANILGSIENRRISVLYPANEERPDVLGALSNVVPIVRGFTHIAPSWLRTNDLDPASSERPVIGYFGRSAPNKGVMYLPKICEMILSAYPQSRFLLHLDLRPEEDLGVYADQFGKSVEAMSKHPRIEIVSGGLGRDEYYQMIDRTNIVLVPYDQNRPGTGIMLEAGMLGKVVVMPSYHYLSEFFAAKNCGVVQFDEWTLGSILQATATAVAECGQRQALARAAIDEVRKPADSSLLFDGVISLLDRNDREPTRWHGCNMDAECSW